MNRFILDTNILIKAPTVLRKWSANYELVIPDLVLEEAGNVSRRIAGAQGVMSLIDDANTKGFVKIAQLNPNDYTFDSLLAKELGLSYVDYLLAWFAKKSSDNLPETYLVTEDRRLSSYAESLGVKTFRLWEFQSSILSSKTVDISKIKAGGDIKGFQFKHLAISFGSGIALTLLSYLLYKYFNVIVYKFPVWSSILIFTIIPFVFYWFRSNLRISYSIAEFSFGFFSVIYVLKPFADDFNISKIYDVTVAIAVVGGIYVMVRGLDNFSKGVSGTSIERPWKKIFKD